MKSVSSWLELLNRFRNMHLYAHRRGGRARVLQVANDTGAEKPRLFSELEKLVAHKEPYKRSAQIPGRR